MPPYFDLSRYCRPECYVVWQDGARRCQQKGRLIGWKGSVALIVRGDGELIHVAC